jgi:hypothetical protein
MESIAWLDFKRVEVPVGMRLSVEKFSRCPQNRPIRSNGTLEIGVRLASVQSTDLDTKGELIGQLPSTDQKSVRILEKNCLPQHEVADQKTINSFLHPRTSARDRYWIGCVLESLIGCVLPEPWIPLARSLSKKCYQIGDVHRSVIVRADLMV